MLFFSEKIKWKVVVLIISKNLIKRKQNSTKTFTMQAYFKAKYTEK